ncbi:glyoxalase [Mycobacterium sp. C31M]
MTLTVAELLVADAPQSWTQAGFTVDTDDTCRVGGVRIRLLGRDGGTGIVGWSLRGLPPGIDQLDRIATSTSTLPVGAPAAHANGVTAIDHLVLMSPNLARTVAALAGTGLQPRRERDTDLGGHPIRQIFYRLGEVILEVVGAPDGAGDGPAELWGITHVVADIGATAAYFGDRTARVKDAVQPGRRITTLRHKEFDMSVRTAMISPR